MKAHPMLISCAGEMPTSPQNYLVPIVIEQRPNGERAYDLYSKLMEERIIMLTSPIEPVMAGIITAQLLYLESIGPTSPIQMFINSPGGYVSAGLDIHDVMRKVECPVHIVCKGVAASMAAVLLAAGDRRLIMPNAEVMIHQPLGGMQGQSADMEIAARHIVKLRDQLYGLLAQYTGQPLEKIAKDSDRDYYMSAEEALAYGLVDEIVQFPEKKLGSEPQKKAEPKTDQ
jgi:ATP-dependent Clp protease protease subunit